MILRHTFIAGAALLFSNGIVLAQDWDWQPEYEHRFYDQWVNQPVPTPPPAGFSVQVGGVVPEGVEIYEGPADFDYAPARRYKYVTVQKRVYVVEPRTRKVVHVIER